MEHPFDRLDGVTGTTVGYTGGKTHRPTYDEVSLGKTGHAEAVRVEFDPDRISYSELLYVFWRNIDPLTADAQFCDHGSQYRSAVFATSGEQEGLARLSKQELQGSDRFSMEIVTEIERAGPFYEAEEYHQNYAEKNPLRYRFYRLRCGRDARLRGLWGNEAGGEIEPDDIENNDNNDHNGKE